MLNKKMKWFAAALILVLALGVFTGCGGDSSDNGSSGGSQTAQSDEDKVYQKGETAEINGLQITLQNVTEMSEMDYFVPADGKVFLVLEFELANNSDESFAMSSLMCFEAYSDDYAVDQSVVTPEGMSSLDGDIASGKKMNGAIVYEVPADYKNFEISFTPDLVSDDKVDFAVTK